jgi:response regulator NasT
MVVDLGRERPLPAVVVASDGSLQQVVKAMQDHVMAYLTEPVTPETLQAAVVVARVRFDQLRELESEVGNLRQALSDRKVIERAKGILMAQERLSEDEAYARLRSESQDRRVKIVQVAQQVVDRSERAASGQSA